MSNDRKSYDEALRVAVVEEIEEGRISIAAASREYGINKSMIALWLREYGKYRPRKSVVEVVMKSEKERISELEKALADATLKVRVYEELIHQADKALKVNIKKTFGTEQSELSSAKGTQSRKSVKRSK